MLPELLSSDDTNVRLVKFNPRSGLYRVSLLFLDDRLWSGGFDACGHGKPGSQVEAYRLASELYSEGEFYSIWIDDLWVGTTGILSWDENNSSVMMGRTLVNPDFWGQRVNSIVKKLLLSHLFSVGVESVKVTAISTNNNSLKALRKLGFREVGRELQVNKYTGSDRDTVNLSLSFSDWDNFIPTDTSPIRVVSESREVVTSS